MADKSSGGSLAIRGLVKSYGAFTAVDDIDLDVPEGSFFALLGPSGCGKTTTLRMVAGLEDPTSGQITIGDTDVSRLRPYQRPVNTVFQNYALFPHMTIFENVAFGLRRKGDTDVRTKVMEMLELVELSHLAQRKPTQLSGGQQQRIAVVRALVNRPKVLLLDEPLGALDLKLRRQLQLELKRIQADVGITFVHVTHDQEEAMTMADTIAVMNKGKVEQLGSPVDLYENPRSPFVAGFLGQTNLLSARVSGTSGGVLTADFHGVSLHMPVTRMAAQGPAVEVGVRPEKIQLADVGQAPIGYNVIDGTIIDASFIGVSTQYLVRSALDAEEELTVFSQNSAISLRQVGEKVSAYWHPDHTFGLHEGAWQEAEAAEVAS
ncbi:spermidine/putrescine transport system ATP-binding protein [Nakamurella panacisegetis]|uniref:Spermidine/putrescine import ATP-binding protein PotA n=1 Tax=Nakamurella panacisegetis TaxID=1090615 RepID=A0A1H0K386_9ACTN|nr:ABC transporter ATP-binding protein [Nakamurella panacisegetis]SDO50485.1 spermidine/putrescine transport system ATP-binding protein [Nakamurella panacisegetis]